jgi:hypothetical protein
MGKGVSWEAIPVGSLGDNLTVQSSILSVQGLGNLAQTAIRRPQP